MEFHRRNPLLKQPPALAPDHRQDADDIPVYGVGANEVGGQLSTAEQPDVLAGPVLQRQNFRHHIGGEKDNPALRRPRCPGGHQESLFRRFGQRTKAVLISLSTHNDGVAGCQEAVEVEVVRRVGPDISLAADPCEAAVLIANEAIQADCQIQDDVPCHTCPPVKKMGERSYHISPSAGKSRRRTKNAVAGGSCLRPRTVHFISALFS